MSSGRADLKSTAVIRNEALRLYARHGPDAVTMRQIAAAAGVSPALVVHHFGSKEGLTEAVDAHVVEIFHSMLDEMDGKDWSNGVVETVLRQLPPDSPVPAYLCRLLLGGSPAATHLFRRLFAVSGAWVARAIEAGILRPGDDLAVRTAFLLANDLALLLLREQLGDVLGVDPLSPEGLLRWTTEVIAIYRDGLFSSEREP